MTPKQAAERLNLTPQRVRDLIRDGVLEASKVASDDNQHGYRWSISEAQLKKFLAKPRKTKPGLPKGYKFKKGA